MSSEGPISPNSCGFRRLQVRSVVFQPRISRRVEGAVRFVAGRARAVVVRRRRVVRVMGYMF